MKAAASALISFLSFLLVASAQDLGSVITQSLFNEMLKHRSDAKCHGGFYTYNAFITAAKSFSGFGASGNMEQRKRDVAAFFAQTSEVTEGVFAKDDPYTWGYCWVKERDVTVDYCTPLFPCAPGRKYFGRGPFQIRGNYEYLNAGKTIGADLIKNPDFVATDPVISFKTAIWYWMTPRSQTKPSLHNVMTGIWKPSAEDIAAHRLPGFGVTTNILNDVECGTGADQRSESRINYYKRYCNLLGVSPGDNLECDTQAPFE